MSNLSFISNDYGERLTIETFTPEQITATIVFCHGITGCRKGRTIADTYFQSLAHDLSLQGFKVVLFDFSGHGDSEGHDYDVCLSKNVRELELVFNKEVDIKKGVSFLAFSYGAAVLCRFLTEHKEVKPEHIVMYSPCFYPVESCFLNENSIFGKDIVKAYNDGSLKELGYATVGAKGFRFGNKMLDDCKTFTPDFYSTLADRILVLSGKQDVILDTKYNTDFCAKNGIINLWFDASHSLFEKLDEVVPITIHYFKTGDLLN